MADPTPVIILRGVSYSLYIVLFVIFIFNLVAASWLGLLALPVTYTLAFVMMITSLVAGGLSISASVIKISRSKDKSPRTYITFVSTVFLYLGIVLAVSLVGLWALIAAFPFIISLFLFIISRLL